MYGFGARVIALSVTVSWVPSSPSTLSVPEACGWPSLAPSFLAEGSFAVSIAGACLVILPVPGSIRASFRSGGTVPSAVSARIWTWSTSPITRASVPGRSRADSSSLESPSGPWSSWYCTFVQLDQRAVLDGADLDA